MTIGYLIFAYRNPRLVARTIKALAHSDARFFIHIDAKCDIAPFRPLAAPNVILLEDRETVFWAEFSGVSAILKLVRHGLADAEPCDYFVLLSGSEFPLRSADYIHAFFRAHDGAEFINLVPIPTPAAGRTLAHLNTFWPPSSQPVRRFFGRVAGRFGLLARDFRADVAGFAPFGGHTWWALSRAACEHILEVTARYPDLVGFFRNAAQPEEFFIHTILGNSPFLARVRRNLLFEDWSAGGCRPKTIDATHLARFEAVSSVHLEDIFGSGEVLFARKLSDDQLDLVDPLEAMIARKDTGCRA